MSKWLAFAQLFLGEAEQIVPIFIHNAKSQQIEGVVLTTLNSALEGTGQTAAPAPAAPAA